MPSERVRISPKHSDTKRRRSGEISDSTNGRDPGAGSGNGHVPADYGSTNLNRYTTDSRIYRWHTDAFHEALLELVRAAEPRTILDAGCGEGFVADEIATELGGQAEITGLDADPEAIAYARAHFGESATFTTGSIYELPYGDDSFDLVVCSEVLEHLDEPMAAARELVRVARSHVLITVPREPIFQKLNDIGKALGLCGDPGHVQFWTKKSFQDDFAPLFAEATFRWKHTYQLLLGEVT